ncbi:hypothetical protein [Pseudomonas sp. EMN2]|uniref:hypothetical protein n=1 Tax=Pseudomonas sp. EMN2 TaxID=2615212 RepID=UPI00129ACF6F|nr:hypothetical protein [Pseudomonas sp. EMN2]
MASKMGVALFRKASAFSTDDNVACEYGGEPFSFNAPASLPKQTLWVTNLSKDSLFEAGLHRVPWLAADDYFRTRLSQMVQELGISQQSIEYQVSLLAEILGNSSAMLRAQLGLVEYPAYGMPQAVGQLYGSDQPAKNSPVLRIAEQACQRYTAAARSRRFENAEVFSFWAPRTQWASLMLAEPLPTGELRLIPRERLPANSMDLTAWATEYNQPIFAKVRVESMDPTIGRLMNYGAGAVDVEHQSAAGTTYDARNFREWCALPELNFLCQYGDVTIEAVAVAGGWTNPGLRIPNSRAASISYAYGIVAENLWVGTLRRNQGTFSIAKSLSTAWLQAFDRMRCLQLAAKLHGAGMEITTYGNGRVGVVCPMSVRGRIPNAAQQLELLYPASLKNLTPYQIRKNNPIHIQQHLLGLDPWEFSAKVDRTCLMEIEAANREG